MTQQEISKFAIILISLIGLATISELIRAMSGHVDGILTAMLGIATMVMIIKAELRWMNLKYK